MENYVDKDNSGAGHHQTDTYNIDPALQDYIPPAAIKTTVPTPAGHGLVQQQTTSDEANPQAYRHGSLAYRPAGAQGSGLHANAYMGASTQFPMAGTFPAPAQQYHGLDAGAAPFIALHQYHGFNTGAAPLRSSRSPSPSCPLPRPGPRPSSRTRPSSRPQPCSRPRPRSPWCCPPQPAQAP